MAFIHHNVYADFSGPIVDSDNPDYYGQPVSLKIAAPNNEFVTGNGPYSSGTLASSLQVGAETYEGTVDLSFTDRAVLDTVEATFSGVEIEALFRLEQEGLLNISSTDKSLSSIFEQMAARFNVHPPVAKEITALPGNKPYAIATANVEHVDIRFMPEPSLAGVWLAAAMVVGGLRRRRVGAPSHRSRLAEAPSAEI